MEYWKKHCMPFYLPIAILIYMVLYNVLGNYLFHSKPLAKRDHMVRTGLSTHHLATNIPVLRERDKLYEERSRDIVEGCKQINRTIEKHSVLDIAGLQFEKKHFIYYCPIHKVGSTFWKRVLTVTNSQGRLTSPFGLQGNTTRLSLWKSLTQNERRIFEERGISFMFVRDPYARLFSAYEDKLFNANPRFWNLVGRDVAHMLRKNDGDVYKNYGFDVTFPELVRYILLMDETGQIFNPHFRPMFNHCDPCITHFDYIGKLETIEDDAMYLISKWQSKFGDFNLEFNDFEKESWMDTVIARTIRLFKTKKILDEINFPFIKLMLRTWRDLQMRGYLSKSISFPFNETDADKITQEEYVDGIRRALEIPVNRTEVKLQRDEALIQAYRQVPLEDMEKIRKYLLEDCLLFGYDDRPKKLFDRSQPIDENFLYLDGLKDN